MVKQLFTKHQRAIYEDFVPGHTTAEIIAMVDEYWAIEMTPADVRSYNHRYEIKSGLNHKKSKVGGRHSYPIGMVISRTAATKDRPDRPPTIKVKCKDGWKSNHRRIWEEAHGPIPSGHKVIFLDGNPLNYSLTNLALVSDRVFLVMNDRHLLSSNKDFTRAGITIAQVISKSYQLKRKKVK